MQPEIEGDTLDYGLFGARASLLPVEPIFDAQRFATLLNGSASRSPAADAAALFELAATGGSDTLPMAVYGLRMVATAAASNELPASPPADLHRLQAAIGLAVAPVDASVAGRIASESIYMAFGATSGLVYRAAQQPEDREPAAIAFDQLDFCLLAADELDALVRRRLIERRGDVLHRKFAIARALNAQPNENLKQ